MTKHPIHDYISIWQSHEPGEYLDYCPCCKVIRLTYMGKCFHYSPKEQMPAGMGSSLRRRFDMMRGYIERDTIRVVRKGVYIGTK